MKYLAIVVALLASGCKSEAEKAEAAYEIAKKNDLQPGDRCAAAHRVKDAYLAKGDEAKYESWSLESANACAEARRLGG